MGSSPVRSLALLLSFSISLLAAGPAFAQKTPPETIAGMQAVEGFEVKLFASEPMIVNPIACDVDTYGRVWVTEGVNYRRNVANPPDNKIKVLEDTDGDGVADKVTVFASDLNAAMGICVAGSKIYVPESPNLYVYEDKNNDLIPDGPRKVLLTGFGGQNHDHGVHSQVFGPDHKLYMTNGDTGYNVTGPDGKTIAFKWGAMIRCEADGTQLDDFAVNFRNPVELAVDSFGNVWCSDNDNDGLKSVRICWILEGGNYGWFGGPENIRNADGSFDPIHHWRADKPGFVPYTLITGFGSPCGMTFYEGDAFGTKYKNQLFHCDAGPREIRAYFPKRLPGVGYSADLENVVTNSDGYFRPVDPCVAPDGSLIVTDWYDGGVGGHAYNDPTRGRIYRINPPGKKLARTGKAGPYATDADALVALASPNHATTFLARERLLASGNAAVPGLLDLTKSENRNLKARALWLLDRIGGSGRDAVKAELASKDPAFRALAVRILRRHGAEVEADLLPLVATDTDGETVKELLLSLRSQTSPSATAALIKAYDRYDGNDRYLLETLAIASKGREAEVFKQVVEAAREVSPRLVNIVRILRPDDATKYLTEKLRNSALPEASQQALIAALSGVPTLEAGKSMLALLLQPVPLDIKKLALNALRQNLNGPWSGLNPAEVTEGLTAALKEPPLVLETLAVIGEANLKSFEPAVVKLIEIGTKEDLRLSGIAVASRLGFASANPGLKAILASQPPASPALQAAAIKALVVLRDPKLLRPMLAGAQALPLAQRQELAGQLVQTIDGAIFLLRLIDTDKALEKPVADQIIATAANHPDVNVRLLFEKFIPADQRPKTLGQGFKAEEILKLKGDAGRGEMIFAQSGAASCNKCHRVKGKGADIGPDLSQIGKKYEQKALLETIMNPSLGIAPEYIPYVVETKAGRVFAGFIHEQSDQQVVLKTIEGNLLNIPRGDIEELVKQKTSLMPELVLKNVTAQDAADLLAYLVSLQSTMMHASSFRAVGPFANVRPENLKQDFGPEAYAAKNAGKIDLGAKYEGRGAKSYGWEKVNVPIGPAGVPVVDLVQLATQQKAPTDNIIYYFHTEIESTADQEATLHIGSDDGIQIWLNGGKVHEHFIARPVAPSQDMVKVKLKQGKNPLLLKLDQGNGGSGLIVSIEARAPLSFVTP